MAYLTDAYYYNWGLWASARYLTDCIISVSSIDPSTIAAARNTVEFSYIIYNAANSVSFLLCATYI